MALALVPSARQSKCYPKIPVVLHETPHTGAAARESPRGNPACRGTFGGRRKAVRDRLALQGGTGPRAPQLEETPETPPSSRAEGLLFLHGLESNPGLGLCSP